MRKETYEHTKLKCPLCRRPLDLFVYMRAYGPLDTPISKEAFGELRFHVRCRWCFLEQDTSRNFKDPGLMDEDEVMECMSQWAKKQEADWTRLCKEEK